MASYSSKPKTIDLCVGKWFDLLQRFGIDQSYLTGKHRPCPICQEGKDRFRFTDWKGSGSWICNQCGSGDGFELLKQITGREFADLAKEVDGLIGEIRVVESRSAIDEDLAIEQRNALWRDSVSLCEGDLATEYLANRGLGDWKPNEDFRCLNHSVIHGGKRIGSTGLIAMVRGPEGEPATMHQTPIIDGKRNGKRYLSRGSFPDG